MLAAVRATPCWMAAGKPMPIGPDQRCRSTSARIVTPMDSGVAGRGDSMRRRSLASSPVAVSITAPLIPVPPTSMPRIFMRSPPFVGFVRFGPLRRLPAARPALPLAA